MGRQRAALAARRDGVARPRSSAGRLGLAVARRGLLDFYHARRRTFGRATQRGIYRSDFCRGTFVAEVDFWRQNAILAVGGGRADAGCSMLDARCSVALGVYRV